MALLFAALLLAGCVQVDIDAGVDVQNTAWLRYRLQIDNAEFGSDQRAAVQQALDKLEYRYRDELGFTVEMAEEGFDVTMEKRLQAASPGEAFDLLKEMLTDSRQTLLTMADLDRADAGLQQVYFFESTVSLQALAESLNMPELPEELRTAIEAALEASGGSFRLSLPASTVEEAGSEATLENGFASIEVPLTFTSPQEVKLVTRVYGELADEQAAAQLETWQWAAFGLTALAALLTAIGLITLLRRRRL